MPGPLNQAWRRFDAWCFSEFKYSSDFPDMNYIQSSQTSSFAILNYAFLPIEVRSKDNSVEALCQASHDSASERCSKQFHLFHIAMALRYRKACRFSLTILLSYWKNISGSSKHSSLMNELGSQHELNEVLLRADRDGAYFATFVIFRGGDEMNVRGDFSGSNSRLRRAAHVVWALRRKGILLVFLKSWGTLDWANVGPTSLSTSTIHFPWLIPNQNNRVLKLSLGPVLAMLSERPILAYRNLLGVYGIFMFYQGSMFRYCCFLSLHGVTGFASLWHSTQLLNALMLEYSSFISLIVSQSKENSTESFSSMLRQS